MHIMTEEKDKRLGIAISPKQRYALKSIALDKETTLQDMLAKLLSSFIEKHYTQRYKNDT